MPAGPGPGCFTVAQHSEAVTSSPLGEGTGTPPHALPPPPKEDAQPWDDWRMTNASEYKGAFSSTESWAEDQRTGTAPAPSYLPSKASLRLPTLSRHSWRISAY